MSTTTVPNTLTGTYTIDPTHSRIGFVARHAMVTKIRGSFNEFSGTGRLDADNPAASSVELVIQAASIDTRNADRDGHLRSNDFFDMETHPEIRFVSSAVEQLNDENYRVTGDLTIKGITKPVELALEVNGFGPDAYGGTRAGFSAKTDISRKEFGVDIDMPMDGGGVVVGDKISVELEIEAVLRTA